MARLIGRRGSAASDAGCRASDQLLIDSRSIARRRADLHERERAFLEATDAVDQDQQQIDDPSGRAYCSRQHVGDAHSCWPAAASSSRGRAVAAAANPAGGVPSSIRATLWMRNHPVRPPARNGSATNAQRGRPGVTTARSPRRTSSRPVTNVVICLTGQDVMPPCRRAEITRPSSSTSNWTRSP